MVHPCSAPVHTLTWSCTGSHPHGPADCLEPPRGSRSSSTTMRQQQPHACSQSSIIQAQQQHAAVGAGTAGRAVAVTACDKCSSMQWQQHHLQPRACLNPSRMTLKPRTHGHTRVLTPPTAGLTTVAVLIVGSLAAHGISAQGVVADGSRLFVSKVIDLHTACFKRIRNCADCVDKKTCATCKEGYSGAKCGE